MKKIIALLLAGIIPAAFAGCSNFCTFTASSKAESASAIETEPAT